MVWGAHETPACTLGRSHPKADRKRARHSGFVIKTMGHLCYFLLW